MKITGVRAFFEVIIIMVVLTAVRLLGFFAQSSNELNFYLMYAVAIAVAAKRTRGDATYFVALFCAALRLYPSIFIDHTPGEAIFQTFNVISMYLFIAYTFNRLYEYIDRLERLSMTCPLTEINNANGFKVAVRAAISTSRRKGECNTVVFIDCDGFKKVNDTRGHVGGDQLLKTIASSINSQLRPQDAAARLGGDEFAILITSLCLEDAASFIARIKRVLDGVMREGKYEVSFSMGAIVYDGKLEATADDLIHEADLLMYEIKKTTKDALKLQMYEARRHTHESFVESKPT